MSILNRAFSSIDKVKIPDEQLKISILSQSIGFFTANLTKDLLETDFFTVQDDVNYSLDTLGISLPFCFTEFLKIWESKMIPNEYAIQGNFSNRRSLLLELYKNGERCTSFKYWTYNDKENLAFVEEWAFLYENKETGDINSLFVIKDSTEAKKIEDENKELEQKHLKESLRSAQMIYALSDDFESVYYFDLETKEMTPYRLSDAIEKEYGEYFRSGPTFDKAFDAYISKTVHADDKKDIANAVSKESLLKNFENKKVYIKDYRAVRNNKILYCQMKIVNLVKKENHHTYLIGFSDITENKEKELERYAYVDPLTNGDNYIKFKKKLSENSCEGHLISIDISSFKIINSICGVSKGDEVIKYLWEFIKANLKDDDAAAHIYADRYVVFLVNRKDSEIVEFTRSLTHTLNFLSIDMEIPQLIPYFGIAKWDSTKTVEEIYSCSVAAKKKVKERKDINYAFFSQVDTDQIVFEKAMEDAFEDALQKGQFEIWYQPKYNPDSKSLVGAEALVRWRKDDGSLVPPGDFIPLFERNGLIRILDEYVFRRVCIQQKEWSDNGHGIVPISVNLSRASLYYKTVPEQYKWIAEKIGIDTKYLPIEITESAAVSNSEIKELTDKFYDAGFPLHMDDFGSGYSSLASLNTMHFDTLKIDKSLVDFIGNYSGDRLLVHSIALAKELGMHVTAEGVETNTQVKFLQDLNCDSIQGYYYSRPLPLPEFEKKIFEIEA